VPVACLQHQGLKGCRDRSRFAGRHIPADPHPDGCSSHGVSINPCSGISRARAKSWCAMAGCGLTNGRDLCGPLGVLIGDRLQSFGVPPASGSNCGCNGGCACGWRRPR
jgi:hypothetical protein